MKERYGAYMEIDYGKAKDAANLPNEQFASLIYAVVLASGGSQAAALAAAANAGALKKKLAGASNEELQQLAASLDPKALESILAALKAGEGQGG
ncbi:MAG: hypothetical protein IJY89_02510 [Clostridia bacterium]|nr:hypothetical protein [Clostridia bacterium]